ncbi:MAG: N-acetyl sugar amidotransferase, partial [Acidimicrobiia bacterium]
MFPARRATDRSVHASATPSTTKYGLPLEVRYCTQCVISNQRPNSAVEFSHTAESKKETIAFTEDGLCDACRVRNMKRETDWAEREEQLRDLLDRHRSRDGSYD